MRLIGMLDSPYVRRVAISLDLLGLSFQHESISVFSTFEQFKKINPVVKAPTLVCEDGQILMDSSIILQFVELMTTNGKSLWSTDSKLRQTEFCAVGMALAVCEKSAQIVYERNLRPVQFQYEPWIERVTDQLLTACSLLNQQVQTQKVLFASDTSQASVTTAVVWQFTQSMLPSIVQESAYPDLVKLSEKMEQTQTFLNYPSQGPGVPSPPKN